MEVRDMWLSPDAHVGSIIDEDGAQEHLTLFVDDGNTEPLKAYVFTSVVAQDDSGGLASGRVIYEFESAPSSGGAQSHKPKPVVVQITPDTDLIIGDALIGTYRSAFAIEAADVLLGRWALSTVDLRSVSGALLSLTASDLRAHEQLDQPLEFRINSSGLAVGSGGSGSGGSSPADAPLSIFSWPTIFVLGLMVCMCAFFYNRWSWELRPLYSFVSYSDDQDGNMDMDMDMGMDMDMDVGFDMDAEVDRGGVTRDDWSDGFAAFEAATAADNGEDGDDAEALFTID